MQISRRRFLDDALLVAAAPSLAPARNTQDARQADEALHLDVQDPQAVCLAPCHLRCDYQVDPPAVDSAAPRLSWELPWSSKGATQSAYQIQAASSIRLLAQPEADLWDSGKVMSDETLQIPYSGVGLASGQQVHWRIRTWNEADRASQWSAPARFDIGLLQPADWKGKWIGAEETKPLAPPRFFRNHRPEDGPATPDHAPALYLKRALTIEGHVSSARLYLCGLGYVQFFLDGKKVGDSVLDPALTEYDRTICYRVFDLTARLTPGRHTLGAILGNGFFNLVTPDLFHYHEAPWRMSPRMLAQLELVLADQGRRTIVTDAQWKLASGPIVFNCVRGGETIDNRLAGPAFQSPPAEADPPARELRAPTGRLVAQGIPPIRITDRIRPVAISEPQQGVYLIDFGRNLAGWTRYRTGGPAGAEITLDHNEVLHADGTLDTEFSHSHTHGRYQHQVCILSGAPQEEFEPRFTYHAFRYVQIRGAACRPDLDDLTAMRMHTDMPRAGLFESSHLQLNQLHDACIRTLEDCTFGMPVSEPVREKIGWNGDTLFESDAYFSLFDCAMLYRQHVALVRDAQEPNGHVPPIFPNGGWGKLDDQGGHEYCDDPWWGGCLADSVRLLHERYADRETLEAAYQDCRRYVDYLHSVAREGIIDWSLGDWVDDKWGMPGGPGLTPVPLTSTVGYFRLARFQARHAEFLGKQDDALRYNRLASEIRDAFNARFFDPASARYQPGSQTAPALALTTGVAPDGQEEKIFQHLLEEIHAAGDRLTAGFIGTMPVFYALCERGQDDLAFQLLAGSGLTGWFWMLQDAFPTLPETPHRHQAKMGSGHHQFSACVAGYLYRCLAGIRPEPEYPGYKRFIVRPSFPAAVDWVKATYHSVRGPIGVHWQRTEGHVRLEVSVPANTQATLLLPGRRQLLGSGSHYVEAS